MGLAMVYVCWTMLMVSEKEKGVDGLARMASVASLTVAMERTRREG